MTKVLKKDKIKAFYKLPQSEVSIADGVYIDLQAKVGVASEATIHEWLTKGVGEPRPVVIDQDTIILSDAVIAEGTVIGKNCFIDRSTRIGFDCIVGDGCRFEYRADVCDRVQIGAESVIGGFLCDGAKLGEGCIVLGSLAHRMNEPDLPWGQYEANPTLGCRVFVGMGAVIVGATIGDYSYVAANATVTKDVPPQCIVTGVNQITPISEWRGALRRDKIT